MKKIIVFLCCSMLFSMIHAATTLQPIINGKTYTQFIINDVTRLGKPQKVIAGLENECGGGRFPDDYEFGHHLVREDGVIREVRLKGNNAVIFYGKRLDANTTEKDFKRWFKDKVTQDSEYPHQYHGQAQEDEYKSFVFYFNKGHLSKYKLWMNDC